MLSLSLLCFCIQHLGAINFPELLHPPTRSSNTSLLHVTPMPSIIWLRQSRPVPVGELSRELDQNEAELGEINQADLMEEKRWIKKKQNRQTQLYISAPIYSAFTQRWSARSPPRDKLLCKIRRGSLRRGGKTLTVYFWAWIHHRNTSVQHYYCLHEAKTKNMPMSDIQK